MVIFKKLTIKKRTNTKIQDKMFIIYPDQVLTHSNIQIQIYLNQQMRNKQLICKNHSLLFTVLILFVLSNCQKLLPVSNCEKLLPITHHQIRNLTEDNQSDYIQTIRKVLASSKNSTTQTINLFEYFSRLKLEGSWAVSKYYGSIDEKLTQKQGKTFLTINSMNISFILYNGYYKDKGIQLYILPCERFNAIKQTKENENYLTIQCHEYNLNYKLSTCKNQINFQISNRWFSVVVNGQQRSRNQDQILLLIILLIVQICQIWSIRNILVPFTGVKQYSIIVLLIVLLPDFYFFQFCSYQLGYILTGRSVSNYNINILIGGVIMFAINFGLMGMFLSIIIEQRRIILREFSLAIISICALTLSYNFYADQIIHLIQSKALLIFYSMIFLPQILHNGRNNIRPKLFSSYYIFFIPIKMLLWYYVRGYSSNIFDIQPDYLLCVFSILLIFIQFGLLYIQHIKGPRTIIPSFLLPKIFIYEYFDTDTDIQQMQDLNRESNQHKQCIICFSQIQEEPPNNFGIQVKYKLMITPCSHIYHGFCLQIWMKQKMECPICRQKLPPIQ